MSTTTPEQTRESCVPNWYGQHLERTTVLSTAHIATMDAALAGILAVVDVLHDRESQRAAGEATHCPSRNMGLLAAVHSLTTLVRLHTTEDTEGLPDFIFDTQGIREARSAVQGHWMRRTLQQAQHLQSLANQPQSHTQQAQAATETVAPKPAKRAASTSTQPIQ